MTRKYTKRTDKIALRDLLVYVSNSDSSNRELGRRTGYHPDAIRKIKMLLPKCPFDLNNLEYVTDTEIKGWLSSYSLTKAEEWDEPDVVAIAKALASKQFDRKQLHDQYLATPSDKRKLAKRTFDRRISEFRDLPDLVLRIDHEPGEAMQVDYAGYRPPYYGQSVKKNINRDLFVAVLGASTKIFATSTADQTSPEWLRAHVQAMEFYGGAPRVWVCDRLRAAVIGKDPRGRAKVNPSYKQLASYYGALVQPARPYRPRDKGLVEACVKLAQRALKASLDKQPVFSIEELDLRIASIVAEINSRVLPRLNGESRDSLFETIDRPCLNTLPPTRFDVFDVAVGKLIARDYTIEFEGNFYSVDYRLVGRRVEVHASSTAVMIVDDGVVVATHMRLTGRGERSVKVEHRPSNHVAMLLTDKERLASKLDSLRPESQAFIETAIEAQSKPVSRRAALAAALDLVMAYGPDEIDPAIAWCETVPTNSITSLERALVGRVWMRAAASTPSPSANLHENVRGPDYYSAPKLGGAGQ
jgi:transposase